MQQTAFVEFAVESTYGSISTSTGQPDVSGLTFTGDEVELAAISFDGLEPISRPITSARGTPAPLPDEVHGPIELLQGQMTIPLVLRGPGDGALRTTGQAMLGWRLIETMLERMDNPGITSEALPSNADDATTLNVTDATAYQIGRLLMFEADGKIQVSQVVGTNGVDQITISPAASSTLQSGQVIRLLDTYHLPRTGELGVPSGAPLALKMRTRDGYGWLLCGVRATALRWAVDDDGYVTLEVDVDVGWGQRFTGASFTSSAANAGQLVNASQAPQNVRGVLASLAGSDLDPHPSSAPDTASRGELNSSGFSLEISVSASPRPQTNWMGRSELRIGGWAEGTQLTLTNVTNNTALRAMYRDRSQRTLAVGTGPFGAGNGTAVLLPAAFLANEVFESLEGDELEFAEVPFRPGAHQSHGLGPGSAVEGGNAALYLGCVFPASL